MWLTLISLARHASGYLTPFGPICPPFLAFPITLARLPALRLSSICFGICGLLTVLLTVVGGPSLRYRFITPVTDLVVAYFVVKLLASQTDAQGRTSMRGIYLSASVGLFAFLMSALLS